MNRRSPVPLDVAARQVRAAVAVGFFAALAAAAWLPLRAALPVCAFHAATGLPCPLCGGTRAAQALTRADLDRALHLNPLAVFLVVLAAAAAALCAIEAVTGRRWLDTTPLRRRSRWFLSAALAGILLWWTSHVYLALRHRNAELVNFKHPVAALATRLVCAE